MSDRTVPEIQSEILAGQAFPRLIRTNDAWYFESACRVQFETKRIKAELAIGVDAPDGGTLGEGSLELTRFGWRINVFDDGIVALKASGFLDWFVKHNTDLPRDYVEVARRLVEELGFEDKTKEPEVPTEVDKALDLVGRVCVYAPTEEAKTRTDIEDWQRFMVTGLVYEAPETPDPEGYVWCVTMNEVGTPTVSSEYWGNLRWVD